MGEITDNTVLSFLNSTDKLISDWEEKINSEYILRSYATERLRNEFCLQTINIYYSCFTASLALLSLKNDNELLTVASAFFFCYVVYFDYICKCTKIREPL